MELRCPKCSMELNEDTLAKLEIKIHSDGKDRVLDYTFCKICAAHLFLRLNRIVWENK